MKYGEEKSDRILKRCFNMLRDCKDEFPKTAKAGYEEADIGRAFSIMSSTIRLSSVISHYVNLTKFKAETTIDDLCYCEYLCLDVTSFIDVFLEDAKALCETKQDMRTFYEMSDFFNDIHDEIILVSHFAISMGFPITTLIFYHYTNPLAFDKALTNITLYLTEFLIIPDEEAYRKDNIDKFIKGMQGYGKKVLSSLGFDTPKIRTLVDSWFNTYNSARLKSIIGGRNNGAV